ncbi:MAG TPA: M12 family metallo-peptidase [Chitinophagales bacterium]|nr:M12 family metallo-peptidase [Chitinophagales bacterium]HRK26177.1 M12 family metallo-peptidase [Chitinophagales bacterium]
MYSKQANNSLFLFIALLSTSLFFTTANAQPTRLVWQDKAESAITVKGERFIVPTLYRTLLLDLEAMQEQLSLAPLEFTPLAQTNPLTLILPMPDGGFERFAVVLSPIMEEGLAKKFPQIKTWAGQGIDDPTATIRFDITQFGFHAQILSAVHGRIFIDPYSRNDTEHYICYYTRNYPKPAGKEFSCLVPENAHKERINFTPEQLDEAMANFRSSDGQLRTYRTAVAATGEYTAFHGGTVAAGVAAITTSLNRVTGVYERDVAVRLTLIANNNLIVYTNSSTDPYSNNDPGALLDEVQGNIDAVIGSANYDVGHVVSTGGGGVASLGVPCVGGSKARGVTGTSSPIGDPFDIDYLAHEMGHQFGAQHTFNGNAGSCSGNRSASSAYEPGSGTTIMAYAGICSPQDLQNNSDDHFHAQSNAQIIAYVTAGSGNNCPVKTATGNLAPTADAGPSYTIPKSTPFSLTGVGTDANGDAITYCWEQWNLGAAGAPNSPSGDAPIFRSFSPTTNPIRVFPKWSDIINNTQTIGELLPSYGRTLNFRLTVRDNRSGGGRIATANTNVVVADGAGPFQVTAPNTSGVTWTAGSTATVTWSVANTTAAPVSCANVDILLSVNGGTTYPHTLATGVPNNGSAVVNIPIIPATTQARVMVRGSGNIFFDISNANFSVSQPSTPTFVMAVSPTVQSVCAPANATYNINITGFAGFSSVVNFSAAGVPPGATAVFSPPTVIPSGTNTLTITNTGSAQQGTYNITITANGGAITQTASVVFAVSQGTPAQAIPTSPVTGAINVSTTPIFAWIPIANAATYTLEIANNIGFSPVLSTQNNLTTNTYTPPAGLLTANATYYWRVRGENGCANGAFSPIYSFTTVTSTCTTYSSTDVPKNISSSGTPTITSNLTISGSGVISDLNVKPLTGTHTYINDLVFNLRSPANTTVLLFGNICGSQNNFNVNLDDEAASANYPCPPTGGGTYKPQGSLADFDGQNANGTWVLTVNDTYSGDGGQLQNWGLEVCVASTPPTAFQVVQLRAFLEGAYNTTNGNMSTNLRTGTNIIPLAQPYNKVPWLYTGTESVGTATLIPTNATDWVIVEARSATDPNVLIARRAGFLLNNGYVIDIDGTVNGVKFTTLTNGTPYYFVLRHRNHVDVMTPQPITLYNHQASYDFTLKVDNAAGANQQKLMSNGVAALIAGDYDGNGVLTFGDFNVFVNQNPASNLYREADGNLDRNVNTADFNLHQINAGHIGISPIRY